MECAGLGTEFVSGVLSDPKVQDLNHQLSPEEGKDLWGSCMLDLINKPTEENPREKISLLSHHQYGSRARIPR